MSYSTPDSTLQLAADKINIIVGEKGIYQVNVKLSRTDNPSKFHIKLHINDKYVSTSHNSNSSGWQVTAHINELFELDAGDRLSVHYPGSNGGSLSKDAMENYFSIHKIASIA